MTYLSFKKTICTAGLSLFFIFPNTIVYAQNWVQVGTDIDGRRANYTSGKSVSFSADGQTLAIGAIGDDNTNADPNDVGNGEVTVYKWEAGNWNKRGNIIIGEVQYDQSGVSIDLSNDGNTVVVGAHSNSGNGSLSGHVRVYEWDGSDWRQKGNDIDGEAAGDRFGQAVSISGDGNTFISGSI